MATTQQKEKAVKQLTRVSSNVQFNVSWLGASHTLPWTKKRSRKTQQQQSYTFEVEDSPAKKRQRMDTTEEEGSQEHAMSSGPVVSDKPMMSQGSQSSRQQVNFSPSSLTSQSLITLAVFTTRPSLQVLALPFPLLPQWLRDVSLSSPR